MLACCTISPKDPIRIPKNTTPASIITVATHCTEVYTRCVSCTSMRCFLLCSQGASARNLCMSGWPNLFCKCSLSFEKAVRSICVKIIKLIRNLKQVCTPRYTQQAVMQCTLHLISTHPGCISVTHGMHMVSCRCCCYTACTVDASKGRSIDRVANEFWHCPHSHRLM